MLRLPGADEEPDFEPRLARVRCARIDDPASPWGDPVREAAVARERAHDLHEESLVAELDTTLVVVAYRVSTIAMADRVLWLEGGRIEASGTHAQLLSHPRYESMVRAYERGAA